MTKDQLDEIKKAIEDLKLLVEKIREDIRIMKFNSQQRDLMPR